MPTRSFQRSYSWRVFVPILLQGFLWFFMYPFVRFVLKVKPHGLENILRAYPDGVILAPNHTSAMDHIILRYSLPLFWNNAPIFFVTDTMKYFEQHIPGMRKILKIFYNTAWFCAWGGYAKQPGQKSYAVSLATHMNILAAGRTLCIFPTGRLYDAHATQEARGGLGFALYSTGKTVVPIGIDGMHTFSWKKALSGRLNAHIAFGAPIEQRKDLEKAQQPDSCRTLSQEILAHSLTLATTRPEAERKRRKSVIPLINDIVSDLYTLLSPRQHAPKEYAFAFLVHPRDRRDIDRKLRFTRSWPRCAVTALTRMLWPVSVSNITGLKDGNGQEIRGFVISIPLAADTMLKHRRAALKQIRRGVRLARNKGAKLIGLGALTSSLSRGGLDLTDIEGISITTGHAYTAHSVVSTLVDNLKKMNITIDDTRTAIAIIGAAGSVGSTSAELLCTRGARRLILIDLERKLDIVREHAAKLQEHYPGADIEITNNMHRAQDAVGIITATNATEALLTNTHVSSGTVIVDDAQPSDIAPELLDRADVLVLEAGAIHTPGVSANFPMGLADREDNFCCLAEVLILASQKHTDHFVINRPTQEHIAIVQEAGEKLGFTLAKPQNETGLISDTHIQDVAQCVQKRYN